MALYHILTVAVFVACSSHVVSSLGNFAHVGVKPGFGPNPDAPMFLTCAVNFTDHYQPELGIINAIAVSITKAEPRRRPYGQQGFLGFQFGGNHFGGGPFGGPHFGGGKGGGSRGLRASIDLFSYTGGSVSLAVTEKGRPERGCFAEDFGDFFQGNANQNSGLLGSFGGPGFLDPYSLGGHFGDFNFGQHFGAINPYFGGAQGISPFGFSHGSGGKGRRSDDDFEHDAPGVIAKVTLAPGAASNIEIENLFGFSDLADLAGRSIVACPTEFVQSTYTRARCQGGILSCCSLHYDMSAQRLTVPGISVSYSYANSD